MQLAMWLVKLPLGYLNCFGFENIKKMKVTRYKGISGKTGGKENERNSSKNCGRSSRENCNRNHERLRGGIEDESRYCRNFRSCSSRCFCTHY